MDTEWLLQPDAKFVEIQHAGVTRKVPLHVATLLWLMGPRTGTLQSKIALLSVAAPDKGPQSAPLSVAVAEEGTGHTPPPWPAWHPEAPPVWHPCPVGVWLGLPSLSTKNGDEVATRYARERCEREGAVSKDMGERCREIVEHGETVDFTETLDYYTQGVIAVR